MSKQKLPKNYHRDWQRRRAAKHPAWYARRLSLRTEARRRRKAEVVAARGGRCKDCKRKYPPEVFDFHHLDPSTKRKTKHRGAGHVLFLSLANSLKELKGCAMLCANCHRIRHAKEAK